MGRKLFCEISPLAYEISVAKCRMVRRVGDGLSGQRFAREKSTSLLPELVYSHKSLIRRQLGNVDMTLQENKAVNLALAAPRVTGVLIKPGEVFSFWHLVGPVTARRGYRTGLTIKQGETAADVGGGMCQFTNLVHWLVLHTPLEIVEHHHHDGYDLFPDNGRQVPFGTGTSILYNYKDYRFKNTTGDAWQLVVYTDAKYLCGELRCAAPQPHKYHIRAEDERFVREGGIVYRKGVVVRECVDKRIGSLLSREEIKQNKARVMYDASGLTIVEEEE